MDPFFLRSVGWRTCRPSAAAREGSKATNISYCISFPPSPSTRRLFGPCSRSRPKPRGVTPDQCLSECGARTGEDPEHEEERILVDHEEEDSLVDLDEEVQDCWRARRRGGAWWAPSSCEALLHLPFMGHPSWRRRMRC